MAEIVDIARGALNAQPFSALLGTKLMQVDSASLSAPAKVSALSTR